MTINVSTEVQRISETLSRMSLKKVNKDDIFYKNTIFSRMNIIFFNDTENVISKCIFSEEDHICFLDRRVISYLYKKDMPFLLNVQKRSYFQVFSYEDHLSFPIERKYSKFSKKKQKKTFLKLKKHRWDFFEKTIFS